MSADERVSGAPVDSDDEAARRVGVAHRIPVEHVADAVTAHQALALHLEAVLKTLADGGADLATLALTVRAPGALEHEELSRGVALIVHATARTR